MAGSVWVSEMESKMPRYRLLQPADDWCGVWFPLKPPIALAEFLGKMQATRAAA